MARKIRRLRADRFVTKLSSKSHIFPRFDKDRTTKQYVKLFCELNHLTR